MNLVKTIFLSGFTTFVKILTGLITIKIIAVYIGPEGVAKLGQFVSVISIVATLAGGGLSLGIIKYVAEYANSLEKLKTFLGNAVSYTLFFSIITMVFGVIFCQKIACWILGDSSYSNLFFCMAIVQVFIAANLLLCAVLNGLKKIRRLTAVNIVGNIFSLAITSISSIYFGMYGVLYAIVISQSILFFITLAFVFREKWLPYLLSFRMQKVSFLNLSRYSLMNIISVISVPTSQIIVRNDLSNLFSWHDVGLWQGVMRISDAYILFVTTALTVYYLPRLAELHDKKAIEREFWRSFLLIMPILITMAALIYCCRNIITLLLYSHSFIGMKNLFLYQLIGDLFRIGGWFFTYLLLAKSWTKTYIITEIILGVIFVLISHAAVRYFGLIGVTYGFAATYLFYFVLMIGVGMLFFRGQR